MRTVLLGTPEDALKDARALPPLPSALTHSALLEGASRYAGLARTDPK